MTPSDERPVPWRVMTAVAALAVVGALGLLAVGSIGGTGAALTTRTPLADGTPPARATAAPSALGGSGTAGSAGPAVTPVPTPSPAAPTPTPTPLPARTAVDIEIVAHPKAVFAHELKPTWCASAGVQITLAVLGLGDTSNAFQRRLQGRVREWQSYADSHNGRWGPTAIARALAAYGANGYEVRTYKTRQAAERDAAKAIELTRSPVLLMAWHGAHTWVMTGFRADADPAVFADSTIKGTYILDPWYPSVSSIWGPSDPPGTFQNNAEMIRNYLVWKRPEGHYKGRDGLWVAVVPTVAIRPTG